jgi:hypothetical protein
VTVTVDGLRAARVPLRAGRAVAEANVLDKARSVLSGGLGWLVLALFGILIAAGILRRRHRQRGRRRRARSRQ